MITKNETTVNVNGVVMVQFGQNYGYFSVRNDSPGTLYASALVPECTAGTDGVISIPQGGSCVINSYGSNTLWLGGSGSAVVIGQWDKINPFKSQAKGGVNIDILMPPARYASGSDDVILDLAGDMSDYALCVLTVSAQNEVMHENASNEDFQYLFSYNDPYCPYKVTASNLSGIILKSDTLTSSQIQINKNGLGRYYSLIGIR